MSCPNIPFCAGDLRHIAVVERKNKTPTDAGGQIVLWVERVRLRCKVRLMNGKEVVRYAQLNAQTTRVFETWWIAGVTPEDRLVFKDKQHNISFVQNIDERDRWMRIYATEGEVS